MVTKYTCSEIVGSEQFTSMEKIVLQSILDPSKDYGVEEARKLVDKELGRVIE